MSKQNKQTKSAYGRMVAKQVKEYNKEIVNSLPAMYAAIGIALRDCCNMDADDIGYIFAYSQKVWTDNALAPSLMIDRFEKDTGILLQRGPNNG